ncbi:MULTISPECIES: efflux RND transporter periplasmic adaptor subunit [Alphaproteobacteria]|uniref:Hemolysin secretion protein D n=2 Tax=Alphaproteobacteria TaxID=28211 RepID=A0A512HJH2_9HYPH|nr:MULTISPECIES: efflux RND transporter periplasmic adaptor subunit [Alphaproteobacteria]GEO85585.1 hemolysin secretion protein D [Ciceribacter naphthalenivorans]GLR22060.1 hemolysin secretion protein D [Ciceribacter naphthalenivorans]GLT04916.1 hemolysin secretion protein D [Sphingomonas psychrolutea]
MVRLTNVTAGLLLLSVAVFPLIAAAEDVPETPSTLSVPSIVVTEAKTRLMVDRIIATGTIKAVEEIYVQPQVEGLSIRSLEADVGDRVPADAVVARLNTDTLLLQKSQLLAGKAKAEASLAQYKVQLGDAQSGAAEAERQFRRAETLGKSGTLSKAAVDQAETALTSATAKVASTDQAIAIAEAEIKVVESQLADIDLKLARSDVKTPVAGLVAARNANVGSIASGAGQPLFTIIRDGEIELVADVSETDILKIRAGQKAKITVAGGAATLSGAVRLVSPVVDPQTRLGAVHIAIDDDQGARSGMYASAEIIIAEANGIALPVSAITSGSNGTTTRLVSDNTVKQVKIETGIQDGAFIEVKTGLKPGDVVVAKAGAFVRDGDHINPVRDETAVSN